MGTLYTCSLSRLDEYKDIRKKYFIVLRPGKVKVRGLRHKPDLAPSFELLDWALEHKTDDDWYERYSAWFRRDMTARAGLRDAISRLDDELAEHDVLLVCFCPDPNKCHRMLIAKEMENRGHTVYID